MMESHVLPGFTKQHKLKWMRWQAWQRDPRESRTVVPPHGTPENPILMESFITVTNSPPKNTRPNSFDPRLSLYVYFGGGGGGKNFLTSVGELWTYLVGVVFSWILNIIESYQWVFKNWRFGDFNVFILKMSALLLWSCYYKISRDSGNELENDMVFLQCRKTQGNTSEIM